MTVLKDEGRIKGTKESIWTHTIDDDADKQWSAKVRAIIKDAPVLKGGEGSGDHGHAGRPGKRGGSAKGKVRIAGGKANPDGVDTMSQYQYPDGSWTPEREALHEKIINSFFANKTPVMKPMSYVLGGAGAVGKSTLVHSGMLGLPDNMITTDSDAIKTMLPEWRTDYTGEGVNPAAFVHEESAYLSRLVAAKAAAEGYNVLLDGTGDSSIESLASKVSAMRANGQRVEGIYVTCDIDTALARSEARFKRTGRIVPKAAFMATHARISRVFPDIVKASLYDKLDLYDTSGSTPQLIATGTRESFTVLDEKAYQAFLDKKNLRM